MPQMSKILQSRDEWRSKAIQRANEIREHRKTQKRFQERVTELKAQISAMKQAEDKKNSDFSSSACC